MRSISQQRRIAIQKGEAMETDTSKRVFIAESHLPFSGTVTLKAYSLAKETDASFVVIDHGRRKTIRKECKRWWFNVDEATAGAQAMLDENVRQLEEKISDLRSRGVFCQIVDRKPYERIDSSKLKF